jgi:hypothetical protein
MRDLADEAVNGVYKNNYGDEYYFNADKQLHREKLPAVIRKVGTGRFHKEWWFNNRRHRTEGAAVEYANGTNSWYYQGEHIDCQTQEEFVKLIKLKAFW